MDNVALDVSDEAVKTPRKAADTNGLRESTASLNRYSLTESFGQFSYPTVCLYCRKLWDNKGNTDLVSPCRCANTNLHVHKACLETRLKDGATVQCEACKSAYSNEKAKTQEVEEHLGRLVLCIIVVLMPIGVVVTVTACVMLDFFRDARIRGEHATGSNKVYPMSIVNFSIVMIFMGLLVVFAAYATVSILRGPKAKGEVEMNKI